MFLLDKVPNVRAKIKRAEQHIAELELEISAFCNGDPYDIVFQDKPNRAQAVIVERADEVPPKISLVAGDAIQNLRTALDQLAYQIFLANSRGISTGLGRNIYFPIFKDAATYTSEAPRKVKGMAQPAIDAINATQPYKGGKGHQLWVLSELNNTDKHRLLITTGLALVGATTDSHGAFLSGWQQEISFKTEFLPQSRYCPLKTGDVLHVTPIDAKVDKNTNFTFQVAFNEPGIVEAEPVIKTIKELADFVTNTATLLANFA